MIADCAVCIAKPTTECHLIATKKAKIIIAFEVKQNNRNGNGKEWGNQPTTGKWDWVGIFPSCTLFAKYVNTMPSPCVCLLAVHLGNNYTYSSAESLSRKPLANGLLTIFNCVTWKWTEPKLGFNIWVNDQGQFDSGPIFTSMSNNTAPSDSQMSSDRILLSTEDVNIVGDVV